MEQLLDYRERLLERFTTIADALEKTIKDIPQQDWHSPREPGAWTPHQILAHIRDAKAYEFLPCIRSILDQDMPSIDCFDREAWMIANYRPDEPVEAIWREIKSMHERELERLRELPDSGWSRGGRHPTWGLRTLQWWVEQSLDHVEEHLKRLNS
jgi:hypothetical protein